MGYILCKRKIALRILLTKNIIMRCLLDWKRSTLSCAQARVLYRGISIKGNVDGFNPAYSFHYVGSSDSLYVFEAPIDLCCLILHCTRRTRNLTAMDKRHCRFASKNEIKSTYKHIPGGVYTQTTNQN